MNEVKTYLLIGAVQSVILGAMLVLISAIIWASSNIVGVLGFAASFGYVWYAKQFYRLFKAQK